jgi:uncharacterized protein involved in exopolysaccharide biosynthesis
MKEKIFSKLKAAVADAKNGLSSISDKTLDAYSEISGKKITDDSQVDAEVETILSLLKVAQANISFVAAKAVTDKEAGLKAEYEKAIEAIKSANNNPNAADNGLEAKSAAAMDDFKKMQEELAAYKTKSLSQERQATIVSKMNELGLTEKDMKYVSVPEDKDITEFLTGYRQHLIDSGLKPLEKDGTKAPDIAAAKEMAAAWIGKIAVPDGSK